MDSAICRVETISSRFLLRPPNTGAACSIPPIWGCWKTSGSAVGPVAPARLGKTAVSPAEREPSSRELSSIRLPRVQDAGVRHFFVFLLNIPSGAQAVNISNCRHSNNLADNNLFSGPSQSNSSMIAWRDKMPASRRRSGHGNSFAGQMQPSHASWCNMTEYLAQYFPYLCVSKRRI